MKNQPTLSCRDERRRQAVRIKGRNGIDYVEIVDDAKQTELCIHLFRKVPEGLTTANVRIMGGRRVRDIQVVGLRVEGDEDSETESCFCVNVDKPGDFSTYKLCIVGLDEDFDPRYACAEFSFKVGCPSDLDCKTEQVCPPEKRDQPEINYLAKDYASFRQLILDRLALIMPDWQERHIPDVGITLVELLAYVGDYLSYYQDAVATEAYLDTARQRISVRRHARLVDYQMHEGCNARAWICIATDQDDYSLAFKDCYFITTPEGGNLPQSSILPEAGLVGLASTAYEVFEALDKKSVTLWSAQNRMEFYTWGNLECCLPKGATSASLKNGWSGDKPPAPPAPDTEAATTTTKPEAIQSEAIPGQPQVGDVLIFEEVIGPGTGNPADADPNRRHAVRLTSVKAITDLLNGYPILEIQWAAEDALPFPFCLSVRLPAPDCTIIENISVARGNLIMVDCGRTIDPKEDLGLVGLETAVGECACEGSVVELTYLAAPFRPDPLKQTPLTFSQPLATKSITPASRSLTQDPRKALPWISLSSIPPAPDGTRALFTFEDWQDQTALAKRLRQPVTSEAQVLRSRLSPDTQKALDQWDGNNVPPDAVAKALSQLVNELLETWKPIRDLMESAARDNVFVVEIDNDGRAHLRFGDGDLGRQPEAGMQFFASYRVGNGTARNVPAESITKIVFRNSAVSGITLQPRNPLPAQGGMDPEPMAEVKLFAPGAFKRVLERAVTAADYATIAERNQKLQQANGALRWTGSWYEAQVAVDPLGSESPDDCLLQDIKRHLYRYRRMGHDLVVNPAHYVPLEIEMTICVLPQYLRGHVEAALLDVFSNRTLPNGQLGFFHPDNLTFGQGIYLSRLVATAQAVTGVQSVLVTKFQRLFAAPAGVIDRVALESGILTLNSPEVAQLDNDPSFPEHGRLTLTLGGGR
jgi:hypothetical protein